MVNRQQFSPSLVLVSFGMLLLLTLTEAWAPVMHHNRVSLLISTRCWAKAAKKDDNVDASSSSKADSSDPSVEANDTAPSAAAPAPAAAPKEDPEVAAIKKEIADLEQQLKGKQKEIFTVKDLAEEYTKVGYARKVAEMENMRRFRSQLHSSNEFSATAAVITDFLPVYDELRRLKELYQEDAFGKNYNALAGNFKTALNELGVEEFSVEVGAPVDSRRVVVIDSEYSDKLAKNTIVRPLKAGLELKGNVVRFAECVASLGSEAEAATAEATATKEEPPSEEETPAE